MLHLEGVRAGHRAFPLPGSDHGAASWPEVLCGPQVRGVCEPRVREVCGPQVRGRAAVNTLSSVLYHSGCWATIQMLVADHRGVPESPGSTLRNEAQPRSVRDAHHRVCTPPWDMAGVQQSICQGLEDTAPQASRPPPIRPPCPVPWPLAPPAFSVLPVRLPSASPLWYITLLVRSRCLFTSRIPREVSPAHRSHSLKTWSRSEWPWWVLWGPAGGSLWTALVPCARPHRPAVCDEC